MIEKFYNMSTTGTINVACKYEDGTVRYWNESKGTTIARVKAIVNQYSKKGYKLTLRQLHYQLVSRNWIVNHDTAYKKLGDLLTDMRYAGIINWDDIEDRGRVPYIPYAVDDAKDAIADAVDTFRIDRQRGQTTVVELWTEKDALSGILRRSTQKYHIRLVVNKGYSSSTAMYEAYERVCEAIAQDKNFTILYFGDHDPSGLDMVRDIRTRITDMLIRGSRIRDTAWEYWQQQGFNIWQGLELFPEYGECANLMDATREETEKAQNAFDHLVNAMYLNDKEYLQIKAIGLTKEQINKNNLPPNPTKLTDTRAKKYIAEHGKTCWEVDALSPEELTAIVETNIQQHIDIDTYNEALEFEAEELDKLKTYIKE